MILQPRVMEEAEENNTEYYTLLNVDRNATPEEVRSAYRRLCRIYHPDRYQDPQKQQTASNFFRKIQEAYKVLSDSRTRLIYDHSGKKGLENDMAVIERTTLPSELLEEYEKLRELWEERTYIQDVNPHGSFSMDVDATPLVDGAKFEDEPAVSVKGISMMQSVDAQFTKSAIGNVLGTVRATKQSILGGIQFSLRYLLSNQNWVKVSTLVGNQPALGIDTYHTLNDRMYITSQTACSISAYGMMISANGGITRRLNDKTSGTLSFQHMANTVSTQVVHRMSSTTDIVGEVSVGVTNSFMKGSVIYRPEAKYGLKAGVKVGTQGVSAFYGAEQEIATLTRIYGTVSVGSKDGVVLKLKLIRALMGFQVKINVSSVPNIPAMFYATFVPLALYGVIKVFAVVPLMQREREKELEEKKAKRLRDAAEKRRDAEAVVELMQETVERIINTEQAKQGLIILEAWYGKLFDTETLDGVTESKIVDVRIPLQCLVGESKLIIRENTKVNVPGFYDPCIGETKHLRVGYEFRGEAHEVTIEDSDPLIIPRRSHRIVSNPVTIIDQPGY